MNFSGQRERKGGVIEVEEKNEHGKVGHSGVLFK